MSVDVVLKDVSGIYGRLLDHRPVLNGEIRYMLKEFEEKRGNREETRLQKAMVDSNEVEKDILPQTLELLQHDLGPLLAKVGDCTKLCEKIISKEDDKSHDSWIAEQRTARDQEWKQFMQEQCEKSGVVDESFKEEKDKMELEYSELESKLNVPSSP